MGVAAKAAAKAVTDCIVAFAWTMVTSSFGAAALLLGDVLDWKGDRTALLYSIVLAVNLVFAEVAAAAGGAVWNPTVPLSFYVAGASADSILGVALRVPAIAAGSAAGLVALHLVMPAAYQHMLGPGPSLKAASVHHGALMEACLAFTQTLVVLVVVLRGTSNRYLQTPIIVTSALTLVKFGGHLTGPGINPSDAFAWAFYRSSHKSVEHVYVYWAMPFLGALIAASAFRAVVGVPGVPGVKVLGQTPASGDPVPASEGDGEKEE